MNRLFKRSLEQKALISLMYIADDHTITDQRIIVWKIDAMHIQTYCLKRRQIRKCKRSNILAVGK